MHSALFTITKTWKQPKCLLMDEWIKKMWCIHRVEYYSTLNIEGEILLCAMTLINLENSKLSEIRQ